MESTVKEEHETSVKQQLDTFEIKYKKKPVYEFLKRCGDIFASLLAIIVFSPLMIIVGLLVKLTSKGPIFYVSERIGRNEKPFKFYKFRSMKVGADQELDELLSQSDREGTFKMKNDPRVTKFGKFIRKTSLDELPQLFNILNGTMSIVGPRPCIERERATMTEKGKGRFLVKQGLTGYWQVHGRAGTSFSEQQLMDLKYVNKRGFWYDIGLIFMTIPAVFTHEGAN